MQRVWQSVTLAYNLKLNVTYKDHLIKSQGTQEHLFKWIFIVLSGAATNFALLIDQSIISSINRFDVWAIKW